MEVTTTISAFMDRDIMSFAKEKEIREGYTPHSVKYIKDKLIGGSWVVVFAKGKGHWKEYVYDWVILLPNVGFHLFQDCCYPTKGKIAYNWKEE